MTTSLKENKKIHHLLDIIPEPKDQKFKLRDDQVMVMEYHDAQNQWAIHIPNNYKR